MTSLGISNPEAERNFRTLEKPADRVSRALDIPVHQFCGLALVFLVSFFNLVNIHVDKEVVALDFQVLLKLLIVAGGGLYGAIGVVTDARIRNVLMTFPVFWMVIIVGFYFVSSIFSISPKVSMVSSAALLSVLLMTVTACVQLGLVRVITTVFHAMSAFVILSWVAFLVWPDVGVFLEPIPGGEFTARMSGLAHSNTLGQYAGLTVVLGVLLYQFYGQRSTWRILMIALAMGALLGSLSRTSLLATLFALAFAYRQSLFTRRNATWTLGMAAMALVGLMILTTQVDTNRFLADNLESVSKSGDAAELTSATGRADIWSYAIYLIGKQPLTGYGAATSKLYLEDYSLYTHNLVLNVAFSTGVFGGAAALFMVLQQLVSLVFRTHVIVNAIVCFILINGLFENVMFSILAGMPTVIWVVALAWQRVESINGGENSVREMTLKERFA